MKKIALVGEAPNDVDAIQGLLAKNFGERAVFFPLLQRIRGSELDNQGTLRRLRIEYEDRQPDSVIFIRDLDGLETDKDYKLKKAQKQTYFTKCKSVVNKNALFLLNIYEIEALILADIDALNDFYQSNVIFTNNTMSQVEPKEFLKQHCKYKEADCPQLFLQLRFDFLQKNCLYFADFIKKLTKIM